ncbi:hypothetical protein LIER_41069 [Lithospermum erythrorhizon]|uniref:Uncharacterized protein n=1 Tax=Lithospermum erythrorhizon TaxID=34254 RepID=A0AAV3R5B1_LITER
MWREPWVPMKNDFKIRGSKTMGAKHIWQEGYSLEDNYRVACKKQVAQVTQLSDVALGGWSRPCRGRMKINSDGSWCKETRQGAAGCISRSDNGEFLGLATLSSLVQLLRSL